MDVWISRDADTAGGWVLAWSQMPKWNGISWYCDDARRVFNTWSWLPCDFDKLFGFLPDCGTCHRMRMQLKPIEDLTTC